MRRIVCDVKQKKEIIFDAEYQKEVNQQIMFIFNVLDYIYYNLVRNDSEDGYRVRFYLIMGLQPKQDEFYSINGTPISTKNNFLRTKDTVTIIE